MWKKPGEAHNTGHIKNQLSDRILIRLYKFLFPAPHLIITSHFVIRRRRDDLTRFVAFCYALISGWKVMNSVNAEFNESPFTDANRNKIMYSVVNDIIPWIEDHLYDENIRVRNVTQRSGYGHWHFQRIFREHTGYSLGEYIRVRRVIRAAISVIYTKKGIIQIAIDNGFTSQQTFSRTFRKYLHAPPARFRKKYINREKDFCTLMSRVFRGNYDHQRMLSVA